MEAHFAIDKFLDGIVVTGVNGVQVQWVVHIIPHVMVILDVVTKTLFYKTFGGSATIELCHAICFVYPASVWVVFELMLE